nr:MAG TPA: hypothetical protein [Caudoviricetes sp.]
MNYCSHFIAHHLRVTNSIRYYCSRYYPLALEDFTDTSL